MRPCLDLKGRGSRDFWLAMGCHHVLGESPTLASAALTQLPGGDRPSAAVCSRVLGTPCHHPSTQMAAAAPLSYLSRTEQSALSIALPALE